MTPDEAYKVFAKFVVANPTATVWMVLNHVREAAGTSISSEVIRGWYNHWRVLWQELAL